MTTRKTPACMIAWGVALRGQQKHHQALQCFEKALQLDPQNEKVHFNLGVLYFDLGKKTRPGRPSGKL